MDKTIDVDETSVEAKTIMLPYFAFMAGLSGDLSKFKEIAQQIKIDWESHEFFGGYSLLHLAAVEGYIDVLKFIIENEGCNHSPRTSLGRTPLHLAAQHRQLEVVRYLVCVCSADPSDQDDNGLNALHHACIGGNVEIVTLLIEEMKKYIPINSVVVETSQTGDTALHLAAYNGHVNIIKLFNQLTSLEVDPNLRGLHNYTPVHYAASNGHEEVVRYLINEWNCNPDCQTENKNTPLHLSSMNGHTKTVTVLKRCDPTCRDDDNLTPLHLAAFNGHLDVVRYLTSTLECDPNIPGHERNTTSLRCSERSSSRR